MKVIYIVAFLVIYLEMIFKAVVLKSVRLIDIGYTILFTMQIILVLNLLCNLFKQKASKIILFVSTIILTIYFMIQAVFYNLFSVPFSFMTLGLAGNALDFTNIIKDAIIQNIVVIILLAIPLILLIVFRKKVEFMRYNKKQVGVWVLIIIAIMLIQAGVIQLDKEDVYSPYNLLNNINAQEKNIEKIWINKFNSNRLRKNYIWI